MLALDQHFQGDSRIGRTKEEAYASIASATYERETRNWGYEKYVTIHADAHRILEEAGEPVPAQKKVRDFLEGIKCHELIAGVAHVRGSAQLLNDFTGASDYLVSFVKKPTASRKSRISTASVRGRGKGRGKSSTKGGRSGRGGSSITARNYTPTEWRALTDEQRAKVTRLREERKRKASSVEQRSELKSNVSELKSNVSAGDQLGLAAGKGTGDEE